MNMYELWIVWTCFEGGLVYVSTSNSRQQLQSSSPWLSLWSLVCGAARANGASDSSNRLQVALAFGMGILVLAYAVGHHSGGQINCAVTLSLVLGGKLAWYQGLTNLFAQLLGSMAGAGLLCVMFPCAKDMSGMTLGTNIIADGFDVRKYLDGRDPGHLHTLLCGLGDGCVGCLFQWKERLHCHRFRRVLGPRDSAAHGRLFHQPNAIIWTGHGERNPRLPGHVHRWPRGHMGNQPKAAGGSFWNDSILRETCIYNMCVIYKHNIYIHNMIYIYM